MVKKFILLPVQFALIMTVLSCKQSSRYPNDFQFRIDAITSSYNSETQEFKRSYIKGDTTIRVPLSEAELQLIYDLAHEMRFLKFPKEFERAKYGQFEQPSLTTTIEISYDGENKKCSVDSGSPKIEIDRPRKFNELADTILEILFAKDQVRNLRKSDFIFL